MKAYKYRIYPTKSQQILLARTFGSCRFVWNSLLGENKDQYSKYLETKKKEDRPKCSYADLSKSLTELKSNPNYAWLYEVSSIATQQKAKDLTLAFSNGFKVTSGQKLPKFKSKHSKQSFRIVGHGVRLKEGLLYLPKDDRHLRIKWTRELPRAISSYTVSKEPDGKHYISFTLVGGDNDRTLTNGTGSLGIDLGLKDLVIDSNGMKYDNPKWYRNSQIKLTKAQRTLSRRKKGSKRRNKAKLKVAKLHSKISSQRKDYLHKLSRKLINENQVIGMEDLMIGSMVKNRHLSKSIMDAGWGSFRQMLTYKASESGHVKLVFLDRWYPSTKTCSSCMTYVKPDISLSCREWTCPNCLSVHDRDINAALNIRSIAMHAQTRVEPDKSIIQYMDYKDSLNLLQPATPVLARLISVR